MQKHLPAYSVTVQDPIGVGGRFRRVAEVTVNVIDEKNPVVKLHRGDIGVASSNVLMDLEPRPVGECFIASWDGNIDNPSIRFDGYPDAPFKFRVTSWYI